MAVQRQKSESLVAMNPKAAQAYASPFRTVLSLAEPNLEKAFDGRTIKISVLDPSEILPKDIRSKGKATQAKVFADASDVLVESCHKAVEARQAGAQLDLPPALGPSLEAFVRTFALYHETFPEEVRETPEVMIPYMLREAPIESVLRAKRSCSYWISGVTDQGEPVFMAQGGFIDGPVPFVFVGYTVISDEFKSKGLTLSIVNEILSLSNGCAGVLGKTTGYLIGEAEYGEDDRDSQRRMHAFGRSGMLLPVAYIQPGGTALDPEPLALLVVPLLGGTALTRTQARDLIARTIRYYSLSYSEGGEFMSVPAANAIANQVLEGSDSKIPLLPLNSAEALAWLKANLS